MAEQINALADGGVEELLAELGLPADSDVTLDLKYVESEYTAVSIYTRTSGIIVLHCGGEGTTPVTTACPEDG